MLNDKTKASPSLGLAFLFVLKGVIMRYKIYKACVLCIAIFCITSCGKDKEDSNTEGTPVSSVFEQKSEEGELEGKNEYEQPDKSFDRDIESDTVDLNGGYSGNQGDIVASGGVFDSIDEDYSSSSITSPVVSNKTEREQMLEFSMGWKDAIPRISVELFKRNDVDLLSMLDEQYPLSIRYIWGQPKIKFESTGNGYRDMWSCSSADGSFSGRIYVTYNSLDEIQSKVVAVETEVVTDTAGLISPHSSIEEDTNSNFSSSEGLTLQRVWEMGNRDDISHEMWLDVFSRVTYEDLILTWGKPEYKDTDSYSCWKYDEGYVCIKFNTSGEFVGGKVEQSLF